MQKNLLITKGALRGILLAYILLLVAFVWGGILQHRQDKQIAANERAITYICSTTTVLDSLVSQQADQIQENFEHGTYDRLLKAGLITKENVRQARMTLASFRKSHRKLTERSACHEIPVRDRKGGTK